MILLGQIYRLLIWYVIKILACKNLINSVTLPWWALWRWYLKKPSPGPAMRTTMNNTRKAAANFILQKQKNKKIVNICIIQLQAEHISQLLGLVEMSLKYIALASQIQSELCEIQRWNLLCADNNRGNSLYTQNWLHSHCVTFRVITGGAHIVVDNSTTRKHRT